jgi:predicted amino acid dehydrogenase
MDPLPVADVTFRSIRGPVVRARYIDVGLLPEAHGGLRRAIARVLLAVEEARALGARLGVLGGFTSIVGEWARADLGRDRGFALTTGNSLTAAVIAEQTAALASHLGNVTVTVVGAGGDVGSGLSRILHSRGARLRLVGRTSRPVERLAAELPGARALSWHDATASCELVVLVASASAGSLPLERLPPCAVVLDAGHPPNREPDGRVAYALAGRVQHAVSPECDLPALATRYAAAETHACLAEGVALAFAGRWESFSRGRGRIHPAGGDEILALAEAHGIRPASLRFSTTSAYARRYCSRIVGTR